MASRILPDGTSAAAVLPRSARLRMQAAALGRQLRAGGKVGALARLLVFRMLTLLSNLATGILVAASLGPQGRGELAAMLIGAQFAGALSLLGLPTAFIYNARTDPRHAGQYFGCAALLMLPASVVAAAAAWAAMPLLLAGHESGTLAMARWLLVILPFSVLIPLLGSVMEAEGRFGLSGVVQSLQPLGCAALLLTLLGLGALSPASAAVAYTLPVLLSCGLAAWLALQLLRPVATLAAPFRPALLAYGSRRYGFEVLASMTSYLDQLLVVYFLPAAAAGTYTAALSLSRALGVFQDAVFSVLFPSLAGRPVDEVVAALGRPLRLSTTLAALAAGVLALVAPALIHLLYGAAFDEAVMPFRLLLAAIVVIGAARILGHVFTATGRPGPVTLVEAVGVGGTLLAMPLLMQDHGAAGAAGAVLIGALLRLGCTLAYFRITFDLPMPRLISGWDDLRGLLRR